MKFLLYFLLSIIWGQDFLFNQNARLGEWVLEQSIDNEKILPSNSFKMRLPEKKETIFFVKVEDQYYFGDYLDKLQVEIKLNNDILRVSFPLHPNQKIRFFKIIKNQGTVKLKASDGSIYLNKSLEKYFFEKIAGQYEDTLFFTKDGKTNFFGYTDYRFFQDGDTDAFDGNGIVFYQANDPCLYQAKFAFSLNKTTLFLYDLTETICSTCRPDFKKGPLLYTFKKK